MVAVSRDTGHYVNDFLEVGVWLVVLFLEERYAVLLRRHKALGSLLS